MDKARFAGRSALEYFGLSPSREISIDGAANKLVKELTEEGTVSSENSYASHAETPASVSKAAVAALLTMHGGEQEASHVQENVSEKIKDARQKYLKQAGTADKARLAAEFDDKVINLLVQRLSARTRLFYCGKAQELSRAVQNGTSTKYLYNQEMAHFLREVMDPGAYHLETEVTNALSLIGDEKGNVVDGLFYLFRGNINGDLLKKMEVFDNILAEILNNKKFGDPEDAKRRDYQRNFIAKAREKLANRLPEPDRTEYFKFEQTERENLSQGRINYDNYRDSVMGWIMARPLEEGLKKALDGKSSAECSEILGNLIKDNGFFNNRYHLVYADLEAKGKVQGIYQRFLGAAHAYVDSKPSVQKTSQEKYGEFLTQAKERLLQALPDAISKAHQEHVKVIDELLQKGYIEREGYCQSRNAYLSGLIAPLKDDKTPGSRAASNAFDKSGLNAPHLEKIVADALQKSIRTNNKKNDTLEALIMCWGGFVNSHRDDFSLGPVCEAKSTYLRTKNSTHANDQLMKFRVDSEFSVEARKQLVKQLPEDLRQPYDAHENLLLDHLGKGHITQETYCNGMVLFLYKHFHFPG